MIESPVPLAKIFKHKDGMSASYYSQPQKTQDEVASVLISAIINNMEPVKTAVDHGIPQLTASTGLIALISEGVLTKSTLDLNLK